jgi:hypothetical protein
MDEAKRAARRKLLAEIEGSWKSPISGEVWPGPVTAQPVQPPTAEMQSALDAAADRLVESLYPPPVTVPSLDELDSGWDGEDEQDEQDEQEEEEEQEEGPEPDLPDERLDPVAHAAAKKARDERIEARRERKRTKAEAKKARRRARAEAAKLKQKGKTKKARPPAVAQAVKVAKAKSRGEVLEKSRRAKPVSDSANESETETEEVATGLAVPRRAKAPPSRPTGSRSMRSVTNHRMLGIAFVVVVAAAIFALLGKCGAV